MMSTAAGGPAIVADRLTRRFGEKTVVDHVSFEVHRAAIYGFLGPNGSGKTTVIRMLCGVLLPSAGTGRVLGHDIRAEAETLKRRIGYMSQKFSLYGDLSVEENLNFYGRIYGLSRARLRERKSLLLALVGMGDRVGQLAATLSGGWKQRLALACALIHEPEMLFLDEPTAGIDPVARRDLWDLLFDLSGRGVTLFVTTHYMDEAERCTHVGYIHSGRLLVHGRTNDLKNLPEVTPAGTRRFELTCPAASSVLPTLRGIRGVRDATLFGETVHLLADIGLDEATLKNATGRPEVASLRAIEPSLEDVFVTLSRTREVESRVA